MDNILTVAQLNEYVKELFDGDPLLRSLAVCGELSNYKIYPSGHHYFSLKDASGVVRCVMFRGSAARLRFRPEAGMHVVLTGRVSVYPRDGAYQFYAESMIPEGVGDLYVAFEQLKARLAEEGLFDPARKRPLPRYTHRIAIVTSGAGAAVQDMLRILGKRYPLSKVMILPVRVQGTEAPAEIAGAIRYVNRYALADVILTGRGGGSMEDLWAFNDERVARMIAASEIPVVSAVGHEPDVTIADFVADVRAATPSNGAELIAPDQSELRILLHGYAARMAEALTRQVKLARQRLDAAARSRALTGPAAYVQERRLYLDQLQVRLAAQATRTLERKRARFARATASLDALSPMKVLGRGYALVQDADGAVVKDAAQLQPGNEIAVQLEKGGFAAQVTQIWEAQDGTAERKL